MYLAIDDDDDKFLWLEDLDSQATAAWVGERNAEVMAATGGGFTERCAEIRRILDAEDRLSYPAMRGPHFYDFWQDKAHPRGLWRRTTPERFRAGDPDWGVLLDVDALAAAEGENWVWSNVEVLRPGYERCLITLSRGGSDAAVVREFDLTRRCFVEGGFALPEAKSRVTWIDENHIFVGTDFGPGSLTRSGYPRVVKRWRRGTPLAEAQVVFEGEHDDVGAYASHDPTPGFERDFVSRRFDFFRGVNYLLTASDELVHIDIPEDASWDVHREWLLVRPRSPWAVGDITYPAGSLLVADFDAYLGGARELTVLFEPDGRTALDSWDWTAGHLIVSQLHDVKSRLEVLTPGEGGWRREPLPGVPEIGHAGIIDTDPDHHDDYLLTSTGFTQPTTLYLGRVGGTVELLRREPAFFDTGGMATRQFFATSADGTQVPYFVVGDLSKDDGPVLMTGYGGFELSLTPQYLPVIGQGWLAKGGRYVVANIRGGGEYGPGWHHAAMRERRPRAYEDFAAVAGDLVRRGLTEPARLGIEGGSNGGLLMGVMLTGYPERFGAIVISAPLLDMRRYHKLLAGASWSAEYGDPDDPADWEFLRGYSPYHNISGDRSYPPVLFVTSTRDDRVHPGHARKMAARLREAGHDMLYYENIHGGHSTASDNEQRAFIRALKLDFLWRKLTNGTV